MRPRVGRLDRVVGDVAAQADRRSAGRASRSSHSFADSRGVDHPAVHVRPTGCAGYMGFEGPHAGRNSGEFKRIATKVCGIDLCEYFPLLAQRCQAQQRGRGRRPRSLAEVLHVGAGRWRHPPRSGQREAQRNFLWSRSSPVRGPIPWITRILAHCGYRPVPLGTRNTLTLLIPAPNWIPPFRTPWRLSLWIGSAYE